MSEGKKLPKGWSIVDLESCVSILDHKRIPVNSTEREKRIQGKDLNDLFPYYGATGQVGWIDDYLFDEELVLLGEDGAPFLDKFKSKAYLISGKSWVNNHAHVLKAKDGITTNRYICHYLNSINYRKYVSGTTRLKLNQTSMKRIQVVLPPLNEQTRIVAKIEELFSELDAGVNYLNAIKKKLKSYRQSVLKAAFEGKLTAEWREKHRDEIEPAEKLLKRIKEEREKQYQKQLDEWEKAVSEWKANGKKGKKPQKPKKPKEFTPLSEKELAELPNLPEGWCWIHLGLITLSMKNGIYKPKSFYSNTGTACLRMYNIQDGKILWFNIKYMQLTNREYEEYALLDGDIIVNRVNSRELVGKSALVKNLPEKCVYESKNIRLRTINEINRAYLNYWLLYFSNRYFNRNAQQTVGMASINQDQLSSLPIPLCGHQEQSQIVQEIESRLSVADKVEEIVESGLKRAEALRQSILKKAFEGKLVPQDPNDEPAQKLLERIKEEKAKIESANKKIKKKMKVRG